MQYRDEQQVVYIGPLAGVQHVASREWEMDDERKGRIRGCNGGCARNAVAVVELN